MYHTVKRGAPTLLLGLAAGFTLLAGGSGCGKGTVWSTKEEVRIGQQVSEEVEQRYRVDATSEDAARIKRIGERLLPHTDARPGVPYSFKVLDSKEVNAVSLPGGPLYVFRGLLDLMGDDDDALAAVIGHELGHTNGRHIARQFTKQLQASILLAVLLSGQGRTTQDIAGVASDLLTLKFSRDDEYDADRRGLSYAYKAGFDPRGLIHFFEKLQALDKGGQSPEFLSTHPVTRSRIERARRQIESNDYPIGK
jgi:predicted Zn-dependent protease